MSVSDNYGTGELRIFFSYAPGAGELDSMTRAALKEQAAGRTVAAGLGRTEGSELFESFEALPVRDGEFDPDAAIKAHPDVLLLPELARCNLPRSRHRKRYQDVQELLKAGIDVYTTVSVLNIESLSDAVTAVTGRSGWDKIPDRVFDLAQRVETVDIEPEELLNGLIREGGTLPDYFNVQNLSALRELALRRAADRIKNKNMPEAEYEFCTGEHILVCLSSSPSNGKIIRTAARMAQAFRGSFTALFVETPDFPAMSEENVQRLRANMRLAEQLGAKIETVYGADVPFQIAEYARLSGVSKIVVGRSSAAKSGIPGRLTLTEKLIMAAPNLDIHIIPDSGTASPYRQQKLREPRFSWADLLKSGAILLLASLIGGIFDYMGFEEANIITIYVLGVLITSIVTRDRIYSLVSSIVSVLIFNFLFTEPRMSLRAYETGYPVTFIIMFISAFLTSTLAVKLKEHARQAALSAVQNKILFDVNQSLQQARDRDEIISVTAGHLNQLTHKAVVIYPGENNGLGEPLFFRGAEECSSETLLSDAEREVALWVYKNNTHAGAGTQSFSQAECLYLAIRINQQVYGVAGICADGESFDSSEKGMILSILGECALALENNLNAREKEEAAVLAQKEQLRANLLRSISHDLRTPLTSISGNASNFLSNGELMDDETKHQLFQDIYDDSMWLINLVENLLSVTRLEENKLNLNISSELLSDVIDEALKHINRRRVEYEITVTHADELLLAKMDVKLIIQVIINLVDNAIKYTPPGTGIAISTYPEGGFAVCTVADSGPGIPEDMKPRIFDMFFSGANTVADSRRSLGMGLALCKSIINAHGGTISVSDNVPRGTKFTFTLPMEEVKLNE